MTVSPTSHSSGPSKSTLLLSAEFARYPSPFLELERTEKLSAGI
jgi:hypothetical protein